MALIFFIFILFFFFLIVLFFFSSPKLSPIPYFPSNKKDLFLIINCLNLKNDQVVIDLGAGDGIVIFNAALDALKKNLNTQFIAVEINPFLILIMMLKRFFHPNKKNIKIVYDDIFKINLKRLLNFDFKFLTFYLYVSPWLIEKIIKNLTLNQLKDKNKKISFVSYFYPIPFLKPKEKIFQGKNKIYLYNL
ncbi:MAG: class I SAM-dependent methyltransferase [Patescibacteria group bacterium]|nr:class I SAM-dependent methyltransferase [Patescibacteria group bacterium]